MFEIDVLTKVSANVKLGGKKHKIGEVIIKGFKDDDDDGDIEVGVAVNLAGNWVVGDGEDLVDIELPTGVIADALGGGLDKFDDLVGAIEKGLEVISGR